MSASFIVLSFDIGVKNLAYCLFEYINDLEFNILDWNVINIATEEKKNVIHHQSDILFEVLHKTFHDKHVDYVVIENQPVLKNPVMKSIQIMVYSYFKILRLNSSSLIKQITMVNASNKIKFAESILCEHVPSMEKVNCDEFKNKYKKTKDSSIRYTRELLKFKELNEHITFFDKFKKKDDLADTLLQGLYFAYNNLKT